MFSSDLHSAGITGAEAFLEQGRKTLASCLPAALGRALFPRKPYLQLEIQGDRADVYRHLGDSQTLLGHLDLHTHKTTLGALLAEGGKKAARHVQIEIPEASLLLRRATFPVQVRKNLSQVIAYEIDRLTPFQPDQVYFDFRPLGTPGQGEKIAVEIALCRRDLIRHWVERLHRVGVPVEAIRWAGAWPGANLLPPGERPKRKVRIFTLNRFLWLLLILLSGAALISPLWQGHQILQQLDRSMKKLRAQAEEVHQVRAAIEQARQGSLAILQQKAQHPRMIDLLRELTDRLPDDTWIQNLEYRNGEVQIRGESAQAAALIGLLERAPGVENVTFRSPVVRLANKDRERFYLVFQYHRQAEKP